MYKNGQNVLMLKDYVYLFGTSTDLKLSSYQRAEQHLKLKQRFINALHVCSAVSFAKLYVQTETICQENINSSSECEEQDMTQTLSLIMFPGGLSLNLSFQRSFQFFFYLSCCLRNFLYVYLPRKDASRLTINLT